MPWVLAATLLGLALRCIGAATTPLTYDEGATLYFARLPWSDLVGPPARLEPNPPLFYALAHLAVATFGERDWALRLPAILAGTLCIPAAALLAGRTAATAASFLVATSAVGVLSSQDARAYAPLTLALLCAAAALLRLVADRPARWAAPTYVLAATAALYLHNTAPLLLAPLHLAILATRPPRAVLRRLLALNLAVFAAWLPWMPVLISQLGGADSNAWMTTPSLMGLRYAVQEIYGQPWLPWPQPWADALFLAALLLGACFAPGRFWRSLTLLLLAGVPAASWAISQVRPIMNGKTLLPLAPFGLVLVAIACARLRRPGAVLAAALVALQLWACRNALRDRPDEAVPVIVSILTDQAKSGDRLYLARPELEILLDHYGWPRDRLTLLAATRRPGWFRNGSIPVGEPGPGPRLWVLTRSAPALQRQFAEALAPAMHQDLDATVGRGRSRVLELSLFSPR